MTPWQRNQEALQAHLKNDDIADFLNWSTIRATMFVGNGASFIEPEFLELTESSYPLRLDNPMCSVIAETQVGNPELLWGWTSGNLIHQAYHLKQWLDRTKQNLSQMTSIVEVGAGYGAMCLICYRLGFKGRYYIIDLPELKQIQHYYLAETEGLKWASWDIQPRFCDLLIACFSLSEMPLAEREQLLSQTVTKEYLFVSSYEFDGVDNEGWFKGLGGKIGYDWLFYPHKWQENVFYMVGTEL